MTAVVPLVRRILCHGNRLFLESRRRATELPHGWRPIASIIKRKAMHHAHSCRNPCPPPTQPHDDRSVTAVDDSNTLRPATLAGARQNGHPVRCG